MRQASPGDTAVLTQPGATPDLDRLQRQFDHQLRTPVPPQTPRDRERIAWILSQVPPDARLVLDVGSGRGRIAEALREGGRTVVALDLSREGLKPLSVHCIQSSSARL